MLLGLAVILLMLLAGLWGWIVGYGRGWSDGWEECLHHPPAASATVAARRDDWWRRGEAPPWDVGSA